MPLSDAEIHAHFLSYSETGGVLSTIGNFRKRLIEW